MCLEKPESELARHLLKKKLEAHCITNLNRSERILFLEDMLSDKGTGASHQPILVCSRLNNMKRTRIKPVSLYDKHIVH